MATPPAPIKLSREDYPEQADWIDKLLWPLVRFGGEVSSVLANITRGQNLVGQVEFVTFETGAAVEDSFPLYFGIKMKTRPVACWIGQIQDKTAEGTTFTTAVFPTWFLTGDKIKISHITGLSINTKYAVTFILE